MASECHHPGTASVLVVSLKCVLHVAMRLTSDDRCHGRYSDIGVGGGGGPWPPPPNHLTD